MTLLKLFRLLFSNVDDRKNYYKILNFINMIMATRRRQVVAQDIQTKRVPVQIVKEPSFRFSECHSVDDNFGFINIYADIETLQIELGLLGMQPQRQDAYTNEIVNIEELGRCQVNLGADDENITFLTIKTV